MGGCIGKDGNGDLLKKACEKDGVRTYYMVDESTPTGVCATLINGVERSLCTNLDAANNYKVDHCKQPEHWKVIEGAKIIYSAGFFVTVSQESIKEASREQAKSGQLLHEPLRAVPHAGAALQGVLRGHNAL